MLKTFLKLLFAAIYFILFAFIIDFIFNRWGAVSGFSSGLALVCLVAAFIASAGLGEVTVKMLEEHL